MSFTSLPSNSIEQEESSIPCTESNPISCQFHQTTATRLIEVENQQGKETTRRQSVRSGRRRSSRERGRTHQRRRGLRRQSSSPGPPPLLVSATHFANDLSPPQSEGSDSSPSTPSPEMATANVDERAERLRREEEESVTLARMLMAEEAMESYARSADFLQQNAQFYSPEDLEALQAALQEDGDDSSNAEDDLSYDTMVRLGERIGDVKGERWALIARGEINKLEEFTYNHTNMSEKLEGTDDSNIKCLVCQCTYEKNERLRKLPCGHCFHSNCVGSWLLEKDSCPYCRQPLIPNHDY